MVVTTTDFRRLIGLAHFFDRKDDNSVIAERLLNGLSSAKTLSQEDISNKIVTMNSRVLLTEISMNRQTEITVTYPQDDDSTARRVSILSPIGVALIGCAQGDIVSWKVPGGIGQFRIDKVIYQPEAAGHYYL